MCDRAARRWLLAAAWMMTIGAAQPVLAQPAQVKPDQAPPTAAQPRPTVAPSCSDAVATPVPAGWRSADRLMLVAKGVSVPKNRAAVLEFHACAAGDTAMLGSYGVVAESETATGNWTFEVMRVNVTRTLRRWLDAHPGSTVCIRMVAVDGSRQPLSGLAWTMKELEIQAGRDR